MLIPETRRLPKLRDFGSLNTWHYFLKALWLFFPSLVFLIVAFFAFWVLPQGKDLMIITLKSPDRDFIAGVYACFIIALIFWVYITWHSTRLVAQARHFMQPDDSIIWEVFRVQTPRILAFTCITVILLSILQLPIWDYPVSSKLAAGLFIASFILFFGIYQLSSRMLSRRLREAQQQKRFLHRVRKVTYAVLTAGFLATLLLQNGTMLVLYIFVLQISLVLLLIVRREIDEIRYELYPADAGSERVVSNKSSFRRKFNHVVFEHKHRSYYWFFIIVSVLAFAIYVASIFSVFVAVKLGSFPFILLAFGVLLGIGNFISFCSVLLKVNLHFFIFLAAFALGFANDPHIATIVDKDPRLAANKFSERQDLREYFYHWLQDDIRRDSIEQVLKSPDRTYPVYFVMSNGGASRSGYWTSGVLSTLEEKSAGNFSKHLFCLSGASGGSVGTSTFFMLLRHRQELSEKNISIVDAANDFMDSDFLTFTLSHMLGPDILRHIFPFLNPLVIDRAGALAVSLERAPSGDCFLYRKFEAGFSSLVTQKGKGNYGLPILCINTTRMQDSHPAVISNINIKGTSLSNNYFNGREDVLSLLHEDKDMKLSTAVVLGASFPYISPAGRIDAPVLRRDSVANRTDTGTEAQYYVDGGYFDNSGAGVVNEMIIAMNNMLNSDSLFARYRGKLRFHVLHISNNEPKSRRRERINPMINDLFAPIRTMLGSYGTQTTINDQRLKSYLYSLYRDSAFYNNIDLYDNNDSLKFSMNWVISQNQLTHMNKIIRSREGYKREYSKMVVLGIIPPEARQ